MKFRFKYEIRTKAGNILEYESNEKPNIFVPRLLKENRINYLIRSDINEGFIIKPEDIDCILYKGKWDGE